jgi:hypothetical protein
MRDPIKVDVTAVLSSRLDDLNIPWAFYIAVLDLSVEHSASVTIHEDRTLKIHFAK